MIFAKSFHDGILTGWVGSGVSRSTFVSGGYQGARKRKGERERKDRGLII